MPTVDELATSLRERLELRGTRKSYREACEYMQRVHITPHLGDRKITDITTADVEGFGDGHSSKTASHRRVSATSSASSTVCSSTASTAAVCARTQHAALRSQGADEPVPTPTFSS